MIILCYHQGALGHTVGALIDCCTKEGNTEFPLFIKNQNLHHYKSKNDLVRIIHPDCDVQLIQKNGNIVISSTSNTINGRLLIMLMGLAKWYMKVPEFNNPVKYTQFGDTFGQQIEVLSMNLLGVVKNESGWFTNANYTFDILNFWEDTQAVVTFLKEVGFTPINDLVYEFCKKVADTNQIYYDRVQMCTAIANDVINHKVNDIDISFYDVAMIHCLLLDYYKCNPTDLKLLDATPKNTKEFINILKD